MDILVKGKAYGKVKNIRGYNYNSDGCFLDAIDLSLKQIEMLKEKNPDKVNYLDVQSLLINDPVFKAEVLKLISLGNDSVFSVTCVLDGFIKPLMESNDEYLKERALDIEDVKNRVLNNLSSNELMVLDDKFVIVVDELHPSFLIENRNNILGVISRKGGSTSHSAILCKEFNIVYVVSDINLDDGDYVLIDDDIVVNPSYSIENNKVINDSEIIKHDGYGFYANVFDNSNLDKVSKYFDGVGLYRTEFVLMKGLDQVKTYKEALNKVGNIIFRTFDVGDDKNISYIKTDKKGVCNYFDNLEVFLGQIRAFKEARVKYIMFPMIRSKKEFNELKQMIDFDARVGMMLETKEALENINDFYDVDFISIGTNDLVYELYGIDRLNQVDDLKYLDDLLIKLKTVVDFCNKHNIKLSLCGEIAGVEDISYRLFKIGIKNLSVSVNKFDVLVNAYKKMIVG